MFSSTYLIMHQTAGFQARYRKPLSALSHTENVGLSHFTAVYSVEMAGLMRLVPGYGYMNKLL